MKPSGKNLYNGRNEAVITNGDSIATFEKHYNLGPYEQQGTGGGRVCDRTIEDIAKPPIFKHPVFLHRGLEAALIYESLCLKAISSGGWYALKDFSPESLAAEIGLKPNGLDADLRWLAAHGWLMSFWDNRDLLEVLDTFDEDAIRAAGSAIYFTTRDALINWENAMNSRITARTKKRKARAAKKLAAQQEGSKKDSSADDEIEALLFGA